MKEVTGVIDHRILLNFRVAPEVMQKNLPKKFTPKIINGYAFGGICQVSLSEMRPKGAPLWLGMNSHNIAHRIAVNTQEGEGVYVTRRYTNSTINNLLGGKVFPGVYQKACFDVVVSDDKYNVTVTNERKDSIMIIKAEVASELTKGSLFSSTLEVSDFFKKGNIGWSSRANDNHYDTIELMTEEWNMEPLHVEESFSAFFSDTQTFPEGSVEFDNAMIMRKLKHSWVTKDELKCL